jgi:hypothetical protein
MEPGRGPRRMQLIKTYRLGVVSLKLSKYFESFLIEN